MARIKTLKQRGSAPAEILPSSHLSQSYLLLGKLVIVLNTWTQKSPLFLSPSSEEQTAAAVSFVYMETREADVWSNFYKDWSLSGHAHFHPSSLLIGQ